MLLPRHNLSDLVWSKERTPTLQRPVQNKTNSFLTYSVFIENFTLYKHSIYKKQKYLALCYLFTKGYTYLKTYKMLKSTLYKITNVRMATSIFATVQNLYTTYLLSDRGTHLLEVFFSQFYLYMLLNNRQRQARSWFVDTSLQNM